MNDNGTNEAKKTKVADPVKKRLKLIMRIHNQIGEVYREIRDTHPFAAHDLAEAQGGIENFIKSHEAEERIRLGREAELELKIHSKA